MEAVEKQTVTQDQLAPQLETSLGIPFLNQILKDVDEGKLPAADTVSRITP